MNWRDPHKPPDSRQRTTSRSAANAPRSNHEPAEKKKRHFSLAAKEDALEVLSVLIIKKIY